ncbi:MAG: hypothetical protein IJY15_13910, partial [Thermoguttaceae bacterium]|nr:hypothetical protein [Thermoguttaceae bacterium]
MSASKFAISETPNAPKEKTARQGSEPSAPVVILADGEFPQDAAAQRFIVDAPTLVCCDGAAEKAVAFGREPDWIVGDLDS